MDTARQILRFSIPGSILLLHAIACYFIYRRCQGVTFVDASTALKENIGALVAVLATIPIGFVVYQAYYLSYSPVVRFWPRGWQGRFVRADRGRRILSSLDQSQVEALEDIFAVEIDVEETYKPVENPKPWYRHPRGKIQYWFHMLELTGELREIPDTGDRKRAYEDRWYDHWDVLRSILDISGTIRGSSQIKTEYTTLSDIYHSLGAARTAVAWAWILVLVLAATHLGRLFSNPAGSVSGLVAISVVTWLLYFVLHSARRRTWKSASSSMRLGLRWLFWRYYDEFFPKDGKKGKKGRGMAGVFPGTSDRDTEADADDPSDNRSRREKLRAYARKKASDVGEMIGMQSDEDEDPAPSPPPSPEPEARRAGGQIVAGIVGFLVAAALLAALWLALDPRLGPGIGASVAICAVVALLTWFAAGGRSRSG